MVRRSLPHNACWGIAALLAITFLQAAAIRLWSNSAIARTAQQLWSISGGSVALAEGLSEDEAEVARKTVVRMLELLYHRQLLPFKTKNYARSKGVLDRVPLERFMAAASKELSGQEHEHCLEWGPFWKHWPNVTQPYMQLFKCKNLWTFNHDAQHPRVCSLFLPAVFGELDTSLDHQNLDEVKGKFDLLIIPQTLQYVVDPHISMRVLYDLIKPGGYLVFTSPFLQTLMPYPTDYYRFTAEGNEKLLTTAGFEILKSYVGGDGFWSICRLMHCGVSDVSPETLENALSERGDEYSSSSYMLSAQLARKPELLSGAV